MAVSLRNHTALITGAGRGIGRAIGLALAEEGCRVALTARSADELHETAALCEARGATALALPADLSDSAGQEELIERCRGAFGGLDIVVNNAGTFHFGSALEADPDAWARVVEVNLTATMRLTRLALPLIAARQEGRRGAVIFIASLAGHFSFPGNAAYSASKHAVIGFAGSVFEDVRRLGIKVVIVSPGWTATRMMDGSGFDPSSAIQPEAVAEAVRFAATFPDSGCPTEIIIHPQRSPARLGA